VPQPLIVYVRVSRVGDREGESFRSPREQEDRARAWAESKGYAVGEVIADLDVSGGVHPQDRPGMSRALEEIRAGRAGGLTAFGIDRYSRDPSGGDWLVNEVTSNGGILTAPDVPEDITTPTGEFTWTMLLGVARLYRRTAGARFQVAQDNATLTGIPVGPVPLGYRPRSEKDRRLEVDPDVAPIIRELFEARAAGAGWRLLAKLLTERTGRRYTPGTIAGRISNPLYRTGRLEYRGVVSEHDAGAIVDAATWHAAQKPRQPRNGRDGKWLLSGLLRCAECGRSLRPWKPSQKQAHTAPRYRCDGDTCPSRVSVHAPATEDLVVQEAFAQDLRLVTKPQKVTDLAGLERALEDAERRFAAIQTPDVQDAMGSDWAANLRERREARDAAAAALVEARQEAGETADGRKVLALGHIWEDLEPSQQRLALRWLFAEVRVAKVPRGQRPDLAFVPRAKRPWGSTLEYRPPEIEAE
jgi:DNA invertase Pin-like site-specific DNA recombinase